MRWTVVAALSTVAVTSKLGRIGVDSSGGGGIALTGTSVRPPCLLLPAAPGTGKVGALAVTLLREFVTVMLARPPGDVASFRPHHASRACRAEFGEISLDYSRLTSGKSVSVELLALSESRPLRCRVPQPPLLVGRLSGSGVRIVRWEAT